MARAASYAGFVVARWWCEPRHSRAIVAWHVTQPSLLARASSPRRRCGLGIGGPFGSAALVTALALGASLEEDGEDDAEDDAADSENGCFRSRQPTSAAAVVIASAVASFVGAAARFAIQSARLAHRRRTVRGFEAEEAAGRALVSARFKGAKSWFQTRVWTASRSSPVMTRCTMSPSVSARLVATSASGSHGATSPSAMPWRMRSTAARRCASKT